MSLSNFFITEGTTVYVNVSKIFSDEYLPFVEDLARMVVLQIVIHLMYFFKDPKATPFVSNTFVEMLLYVIVAVSAYWLIFKRVIKFA